MIAFSIGGIASLVAAVFWGFLVVALVVLVFSLSRVLEATRMLIEGIRQETVPLLGEVKTSVVNVNRELDRVDGMIESAGHIVRSAERISTVVEHTVSSPLIKVAAFGAGAARFRSKLRKKG